jgi:hypothetical protein
MPPVAHWVGKEAMAKRERIDMSSPEAKGKKDSTVGCLEDG